jgi:hypothetical protein
LVHYFRADTLYEKTSHLPFVFRIVFAESVWQLRKPLTTNSSLSWSPEDSLSFEGAGEFMQDAVLPVYSYRFPVPHMAEIMVSVTPENIDFIQISDPKLAKKIPADFIVGAAIEQERNKYFARVWLMPLISVNGDKAARILQGTLNIRLTPIVAGFGGRGPEFKESSVLEEWDHTQGIG